MEYNVNNWNNFCRVFEIPNKFPSGFCFGGGHPCIFQEVDWFYPIADVAQAAISKEEWIKKVGPIENQPVNIEELERKLLPFLKEKQYVKPGYKYLILYDFGGSSVFEGPN